jgi:hypothetical protein
MDEQTQRKIDIEELKNAKILNIINLATLVSFSMLLYYGLGAYKFLKELKKIK